MNISPILVSLKGCFIEVFPTSTAVFFGRASRGWRLSVFGWGRSGALFAAANRRRQISSPEKACTPCRSALAKSILNTAHLFVECNYADEFCFRSYLLIIALLLVTSIYGLKEYRLSLMFNLRKLKKHHPRLQNTASLGSAVVPAYSSNELYAKEYFKKTSFISIFRNRFI